MQYLNTEVLEGLKPETFQKRQPYPWSSIPHTLTEEGFARLHETLPEVSGFRRMEGIKRSYGQGSHDRYILHYGPGIEITTPWKEFIAELQAEPYQSFVRRMFGLGPGNTYIPTLEWYYAWQGCSVSPHCDARRKLGTHIFYFNTEAEWEGDWGGHILILDDEHRFKPHSGPAFDDFKTAAALDARGNGSLLFQRTDHSWHAVRPLGCPSDHLRKLFIVTINVPTLQVWWRRVRGKDPDGYPLVA